MKTQYTECKRGERKTGRKIERVIYREKKKKKENESE
jgi:hypothetical protein